MDIKGNCLVVDKSKIQPALNIPIEYYSFDKFRYMCILAGCDYLPSLPGIGIRRAKAIINSVKDEDIYAIIPTLGKYANVSSLIVPPEYLERFRLADAAFKYQIVYDPRSRELTRLADPALENLELKYLDYAGCMTEFEDAFNLALGNIDPITLETVDNWNPDGHANLPRTSIWLRSDALPTLNEWKTIVGPKNDPLDNYVLPMHIQQNINRARTMQMERKPCIKMPKNPTRTMSKFISNLQRPQSCTSSPFFVQNPQSSRSRSPSLLRSNRQCFVSLGSGSDSEHSDNETSVKDKSHNDTSEAEATQPDVNDDLNAPSTSAQVPKKRRRDVFAHEVQQPKKNKILIQPQITAFFKKSQNA